MGRYLEQLTQDVKVAMKAGEKDRVTVLRGIVSSLKQEKEAKGEDLSDETEMQVLLRAVKSRRESVDQAREHGREDIASKEQTEIELIQTYLPDEMGPEELQEKVREVAAEVGYGGPKDTGKFMGVWMSRYKGLADGKAVQAALKGLA